MMYTFKGHSPKALHQPWDGWIADNATVIGQVKMGQKVSVWFGAVIRGDNAVIRLGNFTNVQENAVLHTDAGVELSVGDYVTIGHQAMLHGCTIGDNSLIGINAVVLNNAVIGKNCIIGANALVPERMVIPDNSLVVGSPAKVIRTLDEQAEVRLKMSAMHYAEHFKDFVDLEKFEF